MKINSFVILSLFALISGGVARRGNRVAAYNEDDPIEERSHVTAFVNTDEGLKVECWEIGDFLPDSHVTRVDGSKGAVRSMKLAGNIGVTLYSFAPGVTIFSSSAARLHTSAVDFRTKPNLFTVKDGLIFIDAFNAAGENAAATENNESQYVFADVNGDDWFYFEDASSSGDDDDDVDDYVPSSKKPCAKSVSGSHFSARTISGSDTTLINFEYDRTPKHRVLHEGRCNFAGLKPLSTSAQSKTSRFRSQEM